MKRLLDKLTKMKRILSINDSSGILDEFEMGEEEIYRDGPPPEVTYTRSEVGQHYCELHCIHVENYGWYHVYDLMGEFFMSEYGNDPFFKNLMSVENYKGVLTVILDDDRGEYKKFDDELGWICGTEFMILHLLNVFGRLWSKFEECGWVQVNINSSDIIWGPYGHEDGKVVSFYEVWRIK